MSEKIKRFIINKGDEKTICETGFEVDIMPYTVLIGENNAGKTNLVTAFSEQEKKNCNIIYFSATNVELEKSEEASTSKKTSPFYQLLAEILKKEKLNLSEDIVGPINAKLAEVTNKINKDIGFIKNKETILRVSETLSEDAVIKNLIPLKIIDTYWESGVEVKPSEIGQGSQRMIIFALMKYYSEQSEKNEKLNFFIVEEPETYLHPKLKQEFNKILSDIAKKENNQVLITTHDPYFVEMNMDSPEEKTVIAIKRNTETGFTERIDIEKICPSASHPRINYTVFGVYSGAFHDELYGALHAKYIDESADEAEAKNRSFLNEFDSYLQTITTKTRKWTEERGWNKGAEKDVSLQTFIRNKLHHPENVTMKTINFTPTELEESTDEMVKLYS